MCFVTPSGCGRLIEYLGGCPILFAMHKLAASHHSKSISSPQAQPGDTLIKDSFPTR